MEVRIRLRAFDSICLRDAHRAFLIQRGNPLDQRYFSQVRIEDHFCNSLTEKG